MERKSLEDRGPQSISQVNYLLSFLRKLKHELSGGLNDGLSVISE
jgi:hypothetical protein